MTRKTKPSTLRYKAMLDDVRERVQHAFSSRNHANPYAAQDKRHARFARALGHTLRMDAVFLEDCEAMGAGGVERLCGGHRSGVPIKPIVEMTHFV